MRSSSGSARACPPSPPRVVIGIGDDAAVLEPERNALEVITTDGLAEGIHFNRRFVGPADIGHKALAVNLSDLAAMGASPRAALLSLLLPPGCLVAEVDALVDGFLVLAARFGVALVGGNISESPGPLVVDVTATGAYVAPAPRPDARRRSVRRRTGRDGLVATPRGWTCSRPRRPPQARRRTGSSRCAGPATGARSHG